MLDDVLMVYGGTGTVALAATGTEYITAQGVLAPTGTEVNAQTLFLPRDVRLKRLRVTLQNAPGAGSSRIFTLRRGGVDTAAAVTIADASKGVSWTGDLVLAANGSLAISSTVTGTPAAARATVSLEYIVVAGAAGMAAGIVDE
jgi:SH3-like domain-containing protein